ncbi:MAG: PDZ domain-containing protein, partial [Bacteroidia bacterium]
MKSKLLPMAAMLAAMIILGSWTFSISDDKNSLVVRLLIQGLSSSHYTDVSINDEFSGHAFDIYLRRLDYNKHYLTAKDIHELEAYRDKLDDQVMAGQYDMYEKSVDLFKKRLSDVESFVDKYLEKPFSFYENEEINLDEEQTGYAADKKELEERWRQLLKYQTLARMVNLKEDQQNELEKGERDAVDSDKELEKKARSGVKKSYSRVFRRMNAWSDKDYRSRYLNAVASTFDPHTNYYAPRDKQDFDEKFTGQYEGIGARLLEQDNGYIKVTEVIPGGPAARQGDLRAEDEIMKVAQGAEEAVDVVNMPVDEAVTLIKGKKGTIVKLTVKRGSEVHTIPITRDVVVLEETYAKSVLVGDEGGPQYGYIRLPSFYSDFQDPNGPNCARDVAREIDKLTDNN